MNELFEQTRNLADEKIEAMMNYPTFYFKKEKTRGIYRIGIDKKTIKAPDAETAQVLAGEGWVLITND